MWFQSFYKRKREQKKFKCSWEKTENNFKIFGRKKFRIFLISMLYTIEIQ